MSEIDWDKAPEGAEFWCDEEWFKNIDGEWFTWYPGALSWAKPAYKSPDNFSWWGNAVERPSPAWSGEGLPPVGCVCEANFVGEWTRFEMRYYGEAYVVFKTAFEVQRTRNDFDTCGVKFRPIRTPEQIAADEREAAIEHMLRTYLDGAKDHRGGIRALYDAGYRKP